MDNHITLPGLNVIRSFEGRSLRAYKDSVGVWTIGYGITNFDTGIGFKVAAGATITAEQAESLLVQSLRANYEPACNAILTAPKPPAFDAAVSFHYNTGGIKRASWPKCLNAGDMTGAKAGLESWCKAGGRTLHGLVRRRAREWLMVANGDYGPEGRSGPELTEPGASGFERSTGKTGAPLTQLPDMPVGAPVPHPDHVPGILKLGDRDSEVVTLRADLAAIGYPPGGSGAAPDLYDADVAKAVMDFQSHHQNLSADARVGPATRAQIVREKALRRTVARKGGAGAVVAAGGAAAAAHAGIDVHAIAGVVTCLLVAGLLYLAIKHSDELWRNFNRLIGRTVP